VEAVTEGQLIHLKFTLPGTADSAATEQACTLVAARISGVPDVKPDEAATPTLSSAEHGAGDESLGHCISRSSRDNSRCRRHQPS